MSSVLSKYMSVFAAKQWKNSLTGDDAANVYFTFGKCTSWTNENSPPQANTSVSNYYEFWNNLIGGKKLSTNDVRHVVPRFDWTTSTVYYQYDNQVDSLELKSGNNKFYVVTDDWNVYKCISNNYGTVSTVKPTSISTITDVQTEDGYIWKYMYTITSEEQLRWCTTEYIPVKTLSVNDGSLQWLVQTNAVDGGIHEILITDRGTGYTANDITVTITGDGQDAAAIASRNVTTNVVQSITVTNKGYGYTYADITISSATGAGAVARAIISPAGGHGYDPLSELGGSNLMINARLKTTEDGVITANNDYRQVALLEDPFDYDNVAPISDVAVNQTTVLSLNGTSADYVEDETVYQGASLSVATFKGTVVEWNSSNNVLKVANVVGTPSSDLVKGVTSTASRFLSSVTNPDMKRYTGKLLYLNNIISIDRSSDQLEDFRIVLRF